MGKSRIEWCTDTLNPLRVRTGGPVGCTKISEGCLHCYASAWNVRLGKMLFGEKGRPFDYQYKPTDFYLDERILPQPLHWRKPRVIFVCSMCDLFHENVPMELQHKVMRMCAANERHTFILLTKRADIMAKSMIQFDSDRLNGMPANIWPMVTVENQERANERIPPLLTIPAFKRGVSVEPMLGPVNLDKWLDCCPKSQRVDGQGHSWVFDGDDPYVVCAYCHERRDALTGKVIGASWTVKSPLDWVICGGESGPGARPMHPEWARSLKDQCVAANVSFFLKQMVVDGKMVKMPELDGRTWEERP